MNEQNEIDLRHLTFEQGLNEAFSGIETHLSEGEPTYKACEERTFSQEALKRCISLRTYGPHFDGDTVLTYLKNSGCEGEVYLKPSDIDAAQAEIDAEYVPSAEVVQVLRERIEILANGKPLDISELRDEVISSLITCTIIHMRKEREEKNG